MAKDATAGRSATGNEGSSDLSAPGRQLHAPTLIGVEIEKRVNDTIGIDISKATLDAFRRSTGEHRQIPNDTTGCEALLRWIRLGRLICAVR